MEVKPLFRRPSIRDGKALWEMVRDDGVLDLNSPYFYLTFCRDFSRTSMVAEQDGELIGMALGYRPESRPDTLFIWQISVKRAYRRRGIARRLIQRLMVQSDHCAFSYLEATVTPANKKSEKLFRAVAAAFNLSLERRICFQETFFPETQQHEPEILFKLGPLLDLSQPNKERGENNENI
ncbi:diaminobutyrate acetyltransferase [Magnetococcales bacterium HHB-1]